MATSRVEELIEQLDKDGKIDYEPQSRIEEALVACINKTGKEGCSCEPQSRVEELLQVHAEQCKDGMGGSGVKEVDELPEELDPNVFYKTEEEIVGFNKTPISDFNCGNYIREGTKFNGVTLNKSVCEKICSDILLRFPYTPAVENCAYVSFMYVDYDGNATFHSIQFGSDVIIYINEATNEEKILYDVKTNKWHSNNILFDEPYRLDEIYSDWPNADETGSFFINPEYDPIVYCLTKENYVNMGEVSVVKEVEGLPNPMKDNTYYKTKAQLTHHKEYEYVPNAGDYFGPNNFKKIRLNTKLLEELCEELKNINPDDEPWTDNYIGLYYTTPMEAIHFLTFTPSGVYIYDEPGGENVFLYNSDTKTWNDVNHNSDNGFKYTKSTSELCFDYDVAIDEVCQGLGFPEEYYAKPIFYVLEDKNFIETESTKSMPWPEAAEPGVSYFDSTAFLHGVVHQLSKNNPQVLNVYFDDIYRIEFNREMCNKVCDFILDEFGPNHIGVYANADIGNGKSIRIAIKGSGIYIDDKLYLGDNYDYQSPMHFDELGMDTEIAEYLDSDEPIITFYGHNIYNRQ